MKRKIVIVMALMLMLLSFAALVALAQDGNEPVPEPDNVQQAAPNVMLPVASPFTYQGYLEQNGMPVNDTCDFFIRLFDLDVGGAFLGDEFFYEQVVVNGRFTLILNDDVNTFANHAFNGEKRWLEIHVRCPTNTGSLTMLTPRVALTAVPQALTLPGLWTQQTGSGNTPNLIGGYAGNVMGAGVLGSVIAGGGNDVFPNHIYDNYGTISGGAGNTVSGGGATVGGGDGNTASGIVATVGGGSGNTASGFQSTTVGGGSSNTASGTFATVGGGHSNTASGTFATVGGGSDNRAAGAYSFAAGRRALANHDGAFVWADSTSNADFASTAAKTFNVRAGGGVNFVVQSSGLSPAGVKIDQQSGNGVGLFISQTSSDAALVVTNEGTGDLIKTFATAGGSNLRFRVTNNGEVSADGQFNADGADFAEMLPSVSGLEAGDVLAIGPDGQLIRTTEAYQPTVVGVYSTEPGFVGGMPIEDATEGKVPLAVVGVVPVKASVEGGMIQPGDMLTASATPGHAMKAKPDAPQGTVIGKALEPLSDDTGVILMLVILQ